jgi:hypothetical protein
MVIRTPPTSPWRPGRCVVTGLYRILQEEIRCWPPKGRNRLPRSLVQIGGDSATQAAHPDSPRALGAHTGRLRHMGFWGGGGQRPTLWRSAKLRTPSAAPALGWATCVGVRSPMHTDLPGNQNLSLSDRREQTFPCRITYPGRAPL